MLGHNKRLERRLKEEGGKQAWATVLESKQEWTSSGGVNMAAGQAGSFTTHQKLRLRVEPEGESSFETTVKQVFHDADDWPIPEAGWSVTVIYNAGDHSKVVIDVDKMPVRPGVNRDEAVARHERVMDGVMERQGLGEVAAQAAIAGRPDSARQEAAARAEQMRAIAHDPMITAEEKRAKIMELSASMMGSPKTVLTGGQVVHAGSAADSVEALTKLADLRDRGVLTDEEFQTEKHKLLGE